MLVRILFLLPLLLVIKPCRGQVTSPGFCPRVRTEPNFNAFLYSGRWFEDSRYFTTFQVGIECSRARYFPRFDGSIAVRNSGFDTRTGMPTVIEGSAFAPDPTEPGRLLVQLQPPPVPPGNYWVLDTDYGSFSIVYSCQDGGMPFMPMKSELLFILKRRRGPLPPPVGHRIASVLGKYGISQGPLMRTRQEGCPMGL